MSILVSDQYMSPTDTAIDMSVLVSGRTMTVQAGSFLCARRKYQLTDDESIEVPTSPVDVLGMGWLVLEKSSGEVHAYFHFVERGVPDPFTFPSDLYEPLHVLVEFLIPSGVPGLDGGSITVNRVVGPKAVENVA